MGYAKLGVNPATYVMAPPTASASPIVTPTSVYPTSTYHPYPPPQATPVAAAAAPVQVYDANTKTSYYAQPPVSPIKNAFTLFPHIVAAATILFWNFQTLKISNSSFLINFSLM